MTDETAAEANRVIAASEVEEVRVIGKVLGRRRTPIATVASSVMER